MITGFWVGLWLAERYINNHQLHSNDFNNLIFISLIVGVLGARLTYAIQFSNAFLADPASLVSLNLNLLDLRGGILFAMLSGLVYGGRKGMEFGNLLDALTPLLAVLMITLGIANLASGSNFGKTTEVPWAIYLWDASRHPTQIYQVIISTAILVAFWPGKKSIRNLNSGQYFLLFIAATMLGYIFLVPYLAEINILIFGFRREQVLAWVILVLCVWGLRRLNTHEAQESS